MQTSRPLLADLSDRELLDTAKQLAARERSATVDLIASLAEIDTRRLYLGEGCGSLFAYCTTVLFLSEHAAYHRIEAARAAARFPLIFERLADGSLTLTNVALVARHLTPDNATAVLDAARNRSKREVERQVAALTPRPDVPSSIRRHPAPDPAPAAREPVASPPPVPVPAVGTVSAPRPQDAPTTALPLSAGGALNPPQATPVPAPVPVERSPAQRPLIAPLSADRYKVQFTVSAETVDKLRRLQDLMRHAVPDGDPAVIFDRAITVLLEQVERTRFAATSRPRAPRQPPTIRSRHIPAAVRREVWARDGEQCTFIGPEGRCQSRGFLQFHHLDPYALGGEATADRITLRCQSHNLFDSEQVFGRRPDVARETPACYGSARADPARASQPWVGLRGVPTEGGEGRGPRSGPS